VGRAGLLHRRPGRERQRVASSGLGVVRVVHRTGRSACTLKFQRNGVSVAGTGRISLEMCDEALQNGPSERRKPTMFQANWEVMSHRHSTSPRYRAAPSSLKANSHKLSKNLFAYLYGTVRQEAIPDPKFCGFDYVLHLCKHCSWLHEYKKICTRCSLQESGQ
jgi:hypothetical protein